LENCAEWEHVIGHSVMMRMFVNAEPAESTMCTMPDNQNFLSVDLRVSLLNMDKANLTQTRGKALGSFKKIKCFWHYKK